MNEKFVKLKIIGYSVYYNFWSHDSHRDQAIKYLNFEPNVDVHFYLIPLPHVRMFPLLLNPPPPLLRTSFMDDPLLFYDIIFIQDISHFIR